MSARDKQIIEFSRDQPPEDHEEDQTMYDIGMSRPPIHVRRQSKNTVDERVRLAEEDIKSIRNHLIKISKDFEQMNTELEKINKKSISDADVKKLVEEVLTEEDVVLEAEIEQEVIKTTSDHINEKLNDENYIQQTKLIDVVSSEFNIDKQSISNLEDSVTSLAELQGLISSASKDRSVVEGWSTSLIGVGVVGASMIYWIISSSANSLFPTILVSIFILVTGLLILTSGILTLKNNV